MRMTHIYKSNKYRSMIHWISQKPRNDRKIKTVKFLFWLSIYKTGQKRTKKELKNIRKRKCQLFLETGCNVSEIVR